MTYFWPSTLPPAPLITSHEETAPETVLRTSMDAGPAKTRQRFTAAVRQYTWTMLVTSSQLNDLDWFYNNSTHGGADPWWITDPRLNYTATYRFTSVPKYKPMSATYWEASFTVEALPNVTFYPQSGSAITTRGNPQNSPPKLVQRNPNSPDLPTQQDPVPMAPTDVPAGGSTGQVLTKASNTDYDTYWAPVLQDNANITANYIKAGPSSGAAALPAYRAMVVADLPATAVTTMSDYGYNPGSRQTFAHSSTKSGINIAPLPGDPSTQADGDMWYNVTSNKVMLRENGVNYNVIRINENNAPGANVYYGTDGTGTKGYYTLPAVASGIGSTQWLFGFGASQTPANLPTTGLIPANWDAAGVPYSSHQMAIGEGCTYTKVATSNPLYGHGYVYVSTANDPSGWSDLGVVVGAAGTPGAAGQGVPTGGTSGQQLTKNSGTDYDTSWQTPPLLKRNYLYFNNIGCTVTSAHNGYVLVLYHNTVGNFNMAGLTAAAAGVGFYIEFVNARNSTSNITIAVAPSDTVGGITPAGSAYALAVGQHMILMSDGGTNWVPISGEGRVLVRYDGGVPGSLGANPGALSYFPNDYSLGSIDNNSSANKFLKGVGNPNPPTWATLAIADLPATVVNTAAAQTISDSTTKKTFSRTSTTASLAITGAGAWLVSFVAGDIWSGTNPVGYGNSGLFWYADSRIKTLVNGNWGYSSLSNVTPQALVTLAHGLGIIPSQISVGIQVNTAQLGYSVGNVLEWRGPAEGANTDAGFQVFANSVNIFIQFGKSVGGGTVWVNRVDNAGNGIGSAAPFTDANIQILVRANAS